MASLLCMLRKGVYLRISSLPQAGQHMRSAAYHSTTKHIIADHTKPANMGDYWLTCAVKALHIECRCITDCFER